MKIIPISVLFLLSTLSLLKAQNYSPTKLTWPVLKTNAFSFYIASENTHFNYSLKNKPISLKYSPAKLPFFCGMEEKCRNKFNFFLKLRAGNDESYLKMIQSRN